MNLFREEIPCDSVEGRLMKPEMRNQSVINWAEFFVERWKI